LAVCCLSSRAFPDRDHYLALADAGAAEKAGDFDSAARALEAAVRRYPRDYALTGEARQERD
jgi:hypothetical protein